MNGAEAIQSDVWEHRAQPNGQLAMDVSTFANGELLTMAIHYATAAKNQLNGHPELVSVDKVPKDWPKDIAWDPSLLAKNNARKAGALLALEWDRLHATGVGG